jgi:hypothetical protein
MARNHFRFDSGIPRSSDNFRVTVCRALKRADYAAPAALFQNAREQNEHILRAVVTAAAYQV